MDIFSTQALYRFNDLYQSIDKNAVVHRYYNHVDKDGRDWASAIANAAAFFAWRNPGGESTASAIRSGVHVVFSRASRMPRVSQGEAGSRRFR
jgi:hypothetical protein